MLKANMKQIGLHGEMGDVTEMVCLSVVGPEQTATLALTKVIFFILENF